MNISDIKPEHIIELLKNRLDINIALKFVPDSFHGSAVVKVDVLLDKVLVFSEEKARRV